MNHNNSSSFSDSRGVDTYVETEVLNVTDYEENTCGKVGSSKLSATFLVINAALGAGLLNYPQAFLQAGGIVAALSVQGVLLVFIGFGLLILAYTSEHVKAATLQDTLRGVGSNSLFCSIAVVLYCFGTCITFLIIIGDQFDRVFLSLVGPDFCHCWYLNRRFTITLSSVLFILPFCYSKRIDFLKYASSLGVVAIVYVVSLVVYQYYTGDIVPGPIKTHPDRWSDLFFAVPVICFGYQCHVSAVPIYACMRDRSLRSFSIVAVTALVVCSIAYSLTGAYGYLTLGSSVPSDILQSYPASHPTVVVAIAAIALKTITTYPILLYCGREAVSNVWVGTLQDSSDLATGECRRRITIATIWFTLSVGLAVVSPDIGVVIDALGSLASVFIFMFPGICLLLTSLHRDPVLATPSAKWFVLGSTLMLCTGAFVLGVDTIQTAERIIANAQTSQKLCS